MSKGDAKGTLNPGQRHACRVSAGDMPIMRYLEPSSAKIGLDHPINVDTVRDDMARHGFKRART